MKRILASLFVGLLLITTVPTADAGGYTLGELKTAIRNRVNDNPDATNKRTWSDTILEERINEAHEHIVNETWCLYSRVLGTITVSVQEYTLPSDALSIQRVSIQSATNDSEYYKLPRSTVRKEDKKTSSWEGLNDGKPIRYYERRNRIGLIPPPNSRYAGNRKLKIDYIEYPDELSDDNAYPFNSRKKLFGYHKLIIDYVSIVCWYDRGLNNKAAYRWSILERKIEEMRKDLKYKPDRSSHIEVGR